MPILSQLYPTYGAALRVLNDLEAAGVQADAIGLVSGEKGAGSRAGPGASEAHTHAQAEALRHGATLVSVRIDDDARVGQIEAILGIPMMGQDAATGERDRIVVVPTEQAAERTAVPADYSVNTAPAGALQEAAPAGAFQERVIEVRATGEEVVVSKEARVVEEIVIRKGAADRTETVRGTVRETKLDIEDNTAPR